MRAVRALAALAFVMAASPAAAHGGAGAVWSAGGVWNSDPRVVVPLYLSAILYLIGTRRLWRRAGHGRGVRLWQAACFWLGWTFLALALVSPLHWLGGGLFTAHFNRTQIIQ